MHNKMETAKDNQYELSKVAFVKANEANKEYVEKQQLVYLTQQKINSLGNLLKSMGQRQEKIKYSIGSLDEKLSIK